MKFLSQLKLLLWKNFTLRKRQTLRNIVEIAWPLVLFFILVAVRTKRTPENIPNIYYRPRAMPSAGFIPFIQSLLCDFRGTGLNYSDAIQSDLPNLQNSSFARFLEDAFPIIENRTLRERVLNLGRDYQKYLADENQWMNLRKMFQNSSNLTREYLVRNALNDPQRFQEFLNNQTGISPRVVQELLNAQLNIQQVDKLMELFDIPAILGEGTAGWAALSKLQNGGGFNQQIDWVQARFQLVQQILQGQPLSGQQVKELLCNDGSPVAIDNLLLLSQGSLKEVRSAICSLDNAKLQDLGNELRKEIKIPTLPNNTAGFNLLEIGQRLSKDLQDLSQDR